MKQKYKVVNIFEFARRFPDDHSRLFAGIVETEKIIVERSLEGAEKRKIV